MLRDEIELFTKLSGEDGMHTSIGRIGGYLDGYDKALENQKWIPCSERMPEQNGKYLVVGRQKAINILKFDGGRWYGKWGVVAWMPLPSPYKGENE